MTSLTFRKPADMHVHFRDGDVLSQVVPFTARQFAYAVVMPNLTPPVTTARLAQEYRARVMAAVPASASFVPLMTCYLTDDTDPQDLVAGHRDGIFTAAKLYPAHATTNSQHGVTSIAKLDRVLAGMAEHGIPLLTHGEVVRHDVDIFDREKLFVDEVLAPTVERYPTLRVVMEHVTTAEAVAFVKSRATEVAATITPQHLLYNRNALFAGGIRPHMYCLPVLKREVHRQALVEAATSGDARFFLGTDSAPHLRSLKENACGCAGIFSAPVAVEAYLTIFEQAGALGRFEAFASLNGPRFYGLEPSAELVTYERSPRQVDFQVSVENDEIVSLFAGGSVDWSPTAKL